MHSDSGLSISIYLLLISCSAIQSATGIENHSGDGSRFKRQSTNGLDLFRLLSKNSGGSIYQVNKANIGNLVATVVESVKSATVLIKRFRVASSIVPNVAIPIDSTITEVAFQIQGSSFKPRPRFKEPDGNTVSFTSSGKSTKNIGSTAARWTIQNPKKGLWSVTRSSASNIWDVEVTAQSTLSFSYRFFYEDEDTGASLFVTGRPLSVVNTSIVIKPSTDDCNVTRISLLNNDGNEINSELLTKVPTQVQSMYKVTLKLPRQPFRILIEGYDKNGYKFVRLGETLEEALTFKIDMLPFNDDEFFKGKTVSIPYKLTNIGPGAAFIVQITDDKGFTLNPKSVTHYLGRGQNVTGTFRIRAGYVAGVSTTVTLSALARDSSVPISTFQIKRLIVIERIVQVEDNDPPFCNITNTYGNCSSPHEQSRCTCSNYTWSATADVMETGFGLYRVFPSQLNAMNGYFSAGNFSIGRSSANQVIPVSIRSTCCNRFVFINAVDVSGNLGTCIINYEQNFAPVTCEPPTSATTTYGMETSFSIQTTTRTTPRIIVNPCTEAALRNENNFHKHPYDRTKYIQCGGVGIMHIITCRSGLVWDQVVSACVRPEDVKTTPTCPQSPGESKLPSPDGDPTRYIRCLNGSSTVVKCPANQKWHQSELKCKVGESSTSGFTNPCKVSSTEVQYYPHPGNHKRFIQCDTEGTAYEFECPNNLVWFQHNQTCADENYKGGPSVPYPRPPSISTVQVRNVCTPNGKLYHTHPTDSRRFLQCTAFGKMFVLLCPRGQVFNSQFQVCTRPSIG